MKDILSTIWNAVCAGASAAWAVLWPKIEALIVAAWNWSLGAYWNGALAMIRNPSSVIVAGTVALASLVYGHHQASVKDKALLASVKNDAAATLVTETAKANDQIKALQDKIKELTQVPAVSVPAKKTATTKKTRAS